MIRIVRVGTPEWRHHECGRCGTRYEATEWAARVATGTVMRPLDPPSPEEKTFL